MKIDREKPSSGNEPRYVMDTVSKFITSSILDNYPAGPNTTVTLLEVPAGTGYDYGVNLGSLARTVYISPVELSEQLKGVFEPQKSTLIEEVANVGPFLNFRLNMAEFGGNVVRQVLKMESDFGKENEGEGKRVVIDMSSPNIAKRMQYGHLRSTIIGDAVANLYRSQGFEVIRDNHLGDWGTQFGNLIVAIKRWGNEKELLASEDPIGGLQGLYEKFHKVVDEEKKILWDEAKQKALKDGYQAIPRLTEAVEAVSQEIMNRKQITRSELDSTKVLEDALDRVIESGMEKEGRAWFLKLEQGNPEARRLWKLCVDLSIKEFNQMYETLGVSFEETLGESFYENRLQNVIDIVRKSEAGKVSEGALVIDMQDKGLGVAMVQKSDGASLYMTRDLACAIYRQEEMGATKAIYVVGEDQKQYFQQLFEALSRLGYKIGENAEHVYFGMVRNKEGKLSTRKGNVVLLKDVIAEAVAKAGRVLEAKNPELGKNELLKATVIRQVAIGALKWNDLSQDAKRPIVYDLDKAINLEGNSAPYVQYAAVRANKILRDSGKTVEPNFPEATSKEVYSQSQERTLIRQMAEYPNILREATRTNNPAKVATYAYELAKRFNSFYTSTPILRAENSETIDSRLQLVAAASRVITNALGILGIEVPERM